VILKINKNTAVVIDSQRSRRIMKNWKYRHSNQYYTASSVGNIQILLIWCSNQSLGQSLIFDKC